MSFGNNSAMSRNPSDIVDEVVSISGLYKKVFGDLLDGLVYNRGLEADIEILERIYGFEYVREMHSPIIERQAFTQLSKIIFRFVDGEQRGIFTKKD